MKITRNFEIDRGRVERIPTFMMMQGFKLEKSLPNYYRFKRGSGWAAFYTFDVRKCPTTVDITLMEGDDNKLEVRVGYEVSGKGMQIFTSGDREKIITEIDNLELFTRVK